SSLRLASGRLMLNPFFADAWASTFSTLPPPSAQNIIVIKGNASSGNTSKNLRCLISFGVFTCFSIPISVLIVDNNFQETVHYPLVPDDGGLCCHTGFFPKDFVPDYPCTV